MKNKNKFFVLVFIITIMVIMTNSVYAANNKAISIGTDFSTPGANNDINTIPAIEHAKYWYSYAGFTSSMISAPTISHLTNGAFSSDLTPILSSDIIFLDGHGNDDRIVWNYQKKGGDYYCGLGTLNYNYTLDGAKMAGVNNIGQNKVKLAILAGCNTARLNLKSDGTYDFSTPNICKKVYDRGTTHVLGWRETVYDPYLEYYLSHFNWAIGNGYTVADAIFYANVRQSLPTWANVTKTVLYSVNSGTTAVKPVSNLTSLGKTAYISNDIEEPAKDERYMYNLDLEYKSVNLNSINGVMQANMKYDGKNINQITEFLSKYDETFNIVNYEMESNEICPGYYFVTLTRKVGEFYTESMYKIIVKDNVITDIFDDTIEISIDKLNELEKKDNEININSMKNIAKDSTLEKHEVKEQEGEVIEQKIYYLYNIEEDKKEIIIYNTYEFTDNTLDVELETFEI